MKGFLSFAAVALLLTACAAPDTVSGDTEPARDESTISGTFSVGDYELQLDCTGAETPTIVFEGGEGASATEWQNIRKSLDPAIRTCAYTRAAAGLDESGLKTMDDAAVDLNTLLSAAEVPGPYLLVGHSAGGMLVQHYARKYPDDVMGVVAMNPVPPWEHVESTFPLMSEGERASETAYFDGENGESFDYRTSSAQILSNPVPSGIAFHMLISTIAQCAGPTDICGRTYAEYERKMEEIATEWSGGKFTQVKSSHDIYRVAPTSVLEVIEEVRTR